jgi:hypothetical protein
MIAELAFRIMVSALYALKPFGPIHLALLSRFAVPNILKESPGQTTISGRIESIGPTLIVIVSVFLQLLESITV